MTISKPQKGIDTPERYDNMGESKEKKTYTQKEIENIISNSFIAGACYGASIAICQDKYPHETVMNVARFLMGSTNH